MPPSDPPPEEANLGLELPETGTPPDRGHDRVSKLEIDGKDFSEPRKTMRWLKVQPHDGEDSVEVVYTFWPNHYTKIIRSRLVKLEPESRVEVSLVTADPARPDRIEAIYGPTPREVVHAMCEMAQIGKDDVVYDVGCGDGRLVIVSVKDYGARKGVGIDIRPEWIRQCEVNAREAGVEDRVTFETKDALTIEDFSEASVVLLFLGDTLNEALRPTLRKTLKPGARIVSHRFRMGDWEPDETMNVTARDEHGGNHEYSLHLWRIR